VKRKRLEADLAQSDAAIEWLAQQREDRADARRMR